MGNLSEGSQSKNNCTEQIKQAPWPVPSKQLVSLLEEKPPGSSLPPRLPGSQPPQQEESRSPTDTGQEPSLSVRSGGSSLLPLELSRRPARLIWWDCSRTPICAPFTPSVSLLCQRISSLLAVSAESVPKFTRMFSLFLCLTKYFLSVWSHHPPQEYQVLPSAVRGLQHA